MYSVYNESVNHDYFDWKKYENLTFEWNHHDLLETVLDINDTVLNGT